MDLLAVIKGVLVFLNWLTGKLDREQFLKMGRDEVILESTKTFNKHILTSRENAARIDGLTDDQSLDEFTKL